MSPYSNLREQIRTRPDTPLGTKQ